MELIVNHIPIAKKRHRHTKTGMTYDIQSTEKRKLKWFFGQQMREKGYSKLCNEPLGVEVIFYTKIPESLSQRKQIALAGTYSFKKPDIDNYLKFYFDVLNGIAYEDDNLISAIYCEKIYSAIPRVEINIKPLGESMVSEHAITVKGEITIEHLDYMIKKSNMIGKSDRSIARVYSQEDREGRHIYFEVEGLKPRTGVT